MAVNGNGVHSVNGVHHHLRSRVLRPGIYAPVPTFFLPNSEDLDLASFEAQVLRISQAGVIPLLSGTMGEAHHLSHKERSTLIHVARRVLDSAGLINVPIVSGTGAGSTRETVELCQEAAASGADAAIVIISGYFAGVLGSHKRALKAFWTEVSQKSPIPVIIYNFPGACGGIELDSETITELATECPNIVGVKLTCGNVGKLTRICATVTEPSFRSEHPRKNVNSTFLVLGGFADFLVPSAFVNGHGAITGLGNVAPYAIVRLFQLSEEAVKNPSVLVEAQHLQGIIARADYTIAKAGIAGTKYLLERLYGYGGVPRKPLPPIDSDKGQALWEHPDTVALVRIERELSGKIRQ